MNVNFSGNCQTNAAKFGAAIPQANLAASAPAPQFGAGLSQLSQDTLELGQSAPKSSTAAPKFGYDEYDY